MRWLHFAVQDASALKENWETVLRRIGQEIPHVDTSLRACALYAAVQELVLHAPAWARGDLAERLGAPAKARSSNPKLVRWICDHWHNESVRAVLARQAATMLRADADRVGREQAALDAIERDDWPWAFLLVMDDEDLRARVRATVGEAVWDAAEDELLREVAPNLWFQMMRPLIDSVVKAYGPAAKVESLERRVRELSWEAAESGERHVRATVKLAAAQREIAELRAALAAEKERAQALEALLLEERKAWSEVVRSLRAGRGDGERERPLEGKRVLIVGGDPVAAGGVAMVEQLGGECRFLPGFDQEQRLQEAVASADLVVAVVAHMSHKHWDIIDTEARRRKMSVVRVNTLGLSTLRRAIREAALGSDGEVHAGAAARA